MVDEARIEFSKKGDNGLFPYFLLNNILDSNATCCFQIKYIFTRYARCLEIVSDCFPASITIDDIGNSIESLVNHGKTFGAYISKSMDYLKS
ncbi:hypothetical protein ASF81_05290 [Brevundimonas sp. Leaf168]|nr:hypothetical protein ASF81_05290 [Brevundimonas sp. Leaf168]